LEAGYDLRAATQILSSDYVYQRHVAHGTYRFHHGSRHELKIAALAGFLSGTAPYYDRFVAGNSQTLRGYNKYDLAPLGANRIVHGSVDYRWRLFQAFYDTGTVGDSEVKHSVGAGLRKDNIQLAVAFPLRGVRMDPVFLIGVNF
jgi:outer membrane protein assembly factor BamA